MFLITPPFSSVFAAALPPHPGWGESLLFQLNGLVVVFLALASIWGVLELTGRYFQHVAAKAIVPVSPDLDWAHEGRRQIFASHHVR